MYSKIKHSQWIDNRNGQVKIWADILKDTVPYLTT